MSVKIKEVLCALEHFAPLPLQEDWDNAGLQVGLTEAEASGALLCLDVTPSIVEEARRKGCNLIVSHHPLIFHALKQVADADDTQRAVRLAIESGIAIVSMHTNMDSARGGVNFKIAEKLGLTDVEFFCPKRVGEIEGGSGVIGSLREPLNARAFINKVKTAFDAKCAACNEMLRRPIERVAICGGAGDFLVDDAIREGVDAFITGEMHYHVYFGKEQRIQLCVIGHYESEHFTSEIFRDIIAESFPALPTYIAETSTNPIIFL